MYRSETSLEAKEAIVLGEEKEIKLLAWLAVATPLSEGKMTNQVNQATATKTAK